MSPNVRIIRLSASVYWAEDPTDPRFSIIATLASGVLKFEVLTELPNGDRGAVSGKEFFAAMIAHFGGRINVIEGNWSLSSGMTANLDALNLGTAAGLSPEDAAALTWTGLRASEHGFNLVQVIQSVGVSGSYTSMQVQFSR